MRLHSRDRRQWFAVNFGKSYFKSAPLLNPSGIIAFAIPCLTLLVVMVLVAHPGFGAGLAGMPIIGLNVELKGQLETLQKDLKGFLEKAAEQQKATGTITEDLKSKIDVLQKQVDAIDLKIAERTVASTPEEPLEDYLKKQEDVARIMRDKSGNCVLHLDAKQVQKIWERKTAVTTAAVGLATSGVLPIERIPGIVSEARQVLRLRQMLAAFPTSLASIDFVKVNAPLVKGSPQTEASDKFENAVTFTTAQEYIRTLATWIPASKQVLDDMAELMNFLMTSLPYYVDLEEEIQMLSGDNTGQNLHGLVSQATAFNTALFPSGSSWNRIDQIGRVIQQITAAKELEPTFFVVHPTDWWAIRLTKDSYGRYILGDPMEQGARNVFGLQPVITTNITAGTFIVGSGSPIAIEIRDRMGMTVEIATQHADYFVKNMIAIRAEKRLALITKRPASFIRGSFSQSPA
jgi:HK97 family phage major capsid protein